MKTILVVDNHPMMLEYMKNLLDKEGYEVLTAKDGLSALEALRIDTPDVIFIDLVMPNIGGDKLCRIIRTMPEHKETPLIIVSAVAAEEKLDVSEFGADACIAKGPFNKMAQHILELLHGLESRSFRATPKQVIGIENVYSRQITGELLSMKKHFEVILEGMSEGILELTSQGSIVFTNPIALSMTGLPEEVLLGSSFSQLFYAEDRAKIEGLLGRDIHEAKRVADESPVRLNGKDVSVSLLPLNEEDNKIIAIIKDVTEQRRLRDQFQQAQRLEAIGTFAGGIAHDFNNLLMAIQGNVSLMLLDVDPAHAHYERLKTIERQVQNGARLTGQLLGYARKGKYEVKPIDLNRLVLETSEAFGRTRKEITIHRELATDLLGIIADQGQIEQTLLNLYVNAADAMSTCAAGGDLFLKTENTTHAAMRGKLYQPEPGDYVSLTVRDTGIGMDGKTMERIFDPFFTTKEMGRGTGLGLASVYGIIKGHAGYIDVESDKGKGTTFSIYLPAVDLKSTEPGVERKGNEGIQKGRGTVLLVDDEEVVLDVGRDLLKALGYRVLTAKSGKEGIAIMGNARRAEGTGQKVIDFVLLDMVMPGMGGSETYDNLKAIDPDVKVILSSGYCINGEATKILEKGCDGFIQKPFRLAELSRTIRTALEKQAGRDEYRRK